MFARAGEAGEQGGAVCGQVERADTDQGAGRVPVGLALGGGERVVRDGQGAADAQVVVLQVVQPDVGSRELSGEGVGGQGPAGGEPRGDDPQGQREPSGEFDEEPGGVRAVQAVAARGPAQEFGALLVRQRGEREPGRAVEGGQRRTAGDDHPAAGAARQQRPYLRGTRGVVQHQERAARREQRTQQRGCGLRLFGDAAGLGAEVTQQGGEGLSRGEGGPARGGAVQVEVELTIGETFRQLMGDVQRERALADTGHAA
ncbi:hypothetical protein QFZ55_004629 [Streptomyces luteogriseus]|nr:hypothetical protein [Streptomyces luteogriseus]